MIVIFLLLLSFFKSNSSGVGEECHRFQIQNKEYHPKIIIRKHSGDLNSPTPSSFGYQYKCEQYGYCAISIYFSRNSFKFFSFVTFF